MNHLMLAFGGLGPWEIILILLVVLVLFGAKKLPELAKGMGQGIKEFKKATRDVNQELERAMDENSPHSGVAGYDPPEQVGDHRDRAIEASHRDRTVESGTPASNVAEPQIKSKESSA